MKLWAAASCLALWSCSSAEPGSVNAEAHGATPAPSARQSAQQAAGNVPAATETASYPLKDWMVANLNRPLRTEDFAALGKSLTLAADFAPPQFPEWQRFARQGSEAAAAHDIERVRASCTDCHNKYRTEYRNKMRTQPLGGAEPRSQK